MSEKKGERFRLVICIGDGEDTITLTNVTEDELEFYTRSVALRKWIIVKDWLGTEHMINPEWISYMYWRLEAEKP